jgi:D-alanyl-D-alanine carboxypeptidase (penicillin-binding protein 5/6)
MTPQSARNENRAPTPTTASRAATPKAQTPLRTVPSRTSATGSPRAVPPNASATGSPRGPVEKSAVAASAAWDAFLVARAEALRSAKSRKHRRVAGVIVFFVLVLAAGPVFDYAEAKYLPERLSGAVSDAASYVKTIPDRFLRLFTPARADRPIPAEYDVEYPEPLASAGDANPNFSVRSLKSSAAILANADNGNVLLKKNADIRVYPASLTKIMTALIAIERRSELPERIVLDAALFQPLYEADSTMAGFLAGEEVRTVDLIYGALLLSGGECSVALAQAVAGSEEAFAALMNARARELGMLDTHFTNATGLHDPEHYSTARDIAKLLLNALGNAEFETIFTTAEHVTAPTDLHEDGLAMTSHVFARDETLTFEGGRILGGKTGWTGPAGQCLASLAEKNGNRYIFVSTGNDVEPDGTAYNFEDARNAYENGILPRKEEHS